MNDKEVAIFSVGYLMGKTGSRWKIETERAFLDLSIKCVCGDWTWATRSIDLERDEIKKLGIYAVLSLFLDEVAVAWERTTELR